VVDVYIISGFLGTGKTSLIQSLIQQKSDTAHWAVLVNEFAQHGADGAMIEAQVGGKNVDVIEVAGGCGCCAAMLPFQQALTNLVKAGLTDVLFIEASGLGHLGNLKSNVKSWLGSAGTLRGAISLLNPQNFFNDKYRDHVIYQQQVLFADGFVVNKTDLAEKDQLETLQSFLMQDGRPFFSTTHGRLPLSWMEGTFPTNQTTLRFSQLTTDEQPRYFSSSLTLSQTDHFLLSKVIVGLSKLTLLRFKACIMTDQGPQFINMVQDELAVTPAPKNTKDFYMEWIDETDYPVEKMKEHWQEWAV